MAIIAPFWAPVDEYVAFKVNHSKVYYQVYTDTEPNNNRTSDILKMASRHVQIYEESSKFANFSATWVLVVTWKNLCPFFYYGPRTFSYNNEEIVRLDRLKCRWVSVLCFCKYKICWTSMLHVCIYSFYIYLFIYLFILLHEKFLQFDWLRAVVFQLNLKYLHVKITTFCG